MRTRFAPSPTGPLHLGHAFSAITAHDMARAAGGVFLLRIDDIDRSRARPHWEDAILGDLRWLGISWDEGLRRQSDHLDSYAAALDTLAARGLTYPCSCRRRDIEAAASAPQEGDGTRTHGPDGRIYPGTCRGRPMSAMRDGDALRLDVARAFPDLDIRFEETGPAHAGHHRVTTHHLAAHVGDPVLARPQMGASYHFSVVIDDAAQSVTHVVRGEDLFEAAFLHAALHHLLGTPVPAFHHHRLIRDEDGKRLAKRDDARALSTYRAVGASPADIRRMLGLPLHLS
ncbi:tRNA glutamyl-Q(34) synthetase GluQRS [Roseibacterium sp. SDUM158017]|uniref:tRNA glutamyl-Q(34) synthetase GluQRS n=1 Tax=Roseicyclus salinarum TaxID=3036773 RepID=UPI00241513DE|nr:tRNA glutamyl-Q(34) synthetase GluQRS [Roseibacterium sp. SDUM158017]MDG4650344.1 tRNA glutamyl-Q(34) synthetase GluQRS [Roseibacterium sp. SDUM158017]